MCLLEMADVRRVEKMRDVDCMQYGMTVEEMTESK